MPNDVKLQEGHPVDENLRPIKVGGISTAIETAQHGNGARINGDLDITGDLDIGGDLDITGDLDIGGDIAKDGTLKIQGNATTDIELVSGNDSPRVSLVDNDDKIASRWSSDGTNTTLTLYEPGGDPSADRMEINTTAAGLSTISTNDGGGEGADLTLDIDGDITLDSHTGVFEMKKAGTKFADTYAGMILGYTRISNDSTTTGHAEINPDATMTVLQTAQGTDVSVTFTAPPSGNVEISMLCSLYANSRTLEFALSDNASFNEIGETHTYDAGAQSSDETDANMTYISFVNTGLTPGTEYERWIAAAETISGTSAIRHGRNRTTGFHYPPIIVKATALPATIVTGE